MTIEYLKEMKHQINKDRFEVIQNIFKIYPNELKYQKIRQETVKEANEIYETSLRVIYQEYSKLKKDK